MRTLPFTYCRAVAPLALLLLSGCGGGSGAGSAALPDSAKTTLTSTRETPTTDEPTTGPTTATTLLVPDSSAAGSADAPAAEAAASPPRGKLVVRLPATAPTDQIHRRAYQAAAAILPDFANDINQELSLPRDVVLTVSDSDELNAYYSASTHSITVNYGLLLHVLVQVNESTAHSDTGDETTRSAVGVLSFVLFHELGHCLIHECDLPVPGREEDDADQLATLFMTSNPTATTGQSLAGAALFFAQMAETDAAKIAWDDSHSIGQQRAYNILGWLYGSDPARMRGLVDNKVLSAERAQDGIEEYRRIKRAWANYLKPYSKS